MTKAKTPDFTAFGNWMPGFDFLQNLAKQTANTSASSSIQLPNLGSWVAPTLNVEELEKRITELKAVQFWLDQNATALKASIQALEVQKMTLATLQSMNFNMGDVANAMKIKEPDTASSKVSKASDTKANTSAGMVDPMQWWGALTQQFGQIAATAMKDAAMTKASAASTNDAKPKPSARTTRKSK